MIVLLDTHCWVWWISTPTRLNDTARALIADRRNKVYFSAASAWEIAIKWRSGRLTLPSPPHLWWPAAFESSAFEVLVLTPEHALAVAGLPDHHADPFDRVLVAQAQLEGLTIVTSDAAFDEYDVPVLDARA